MPRPPDLPSIEDPYTGETRVLGSIPTDPRLVAALPTYSGEVLPESELREFDHWPRQIKIKDQNGKGACNGFATAMAMMIARHVQGMEYVDLSGWYIYSILCNGVDRGSNILQAFELIGTDGIAPEETVPYGLINPRKLSDEARAAAPRFRMELGERLTSFRQMVSHVALGGALNYSLHAWDGFNTLDAEGAPGVRKGQGNHAVSGGLALKKSKKHGWMPRGVNSWSPRWGDDGFFGITERLIEAGSYFEAFTVRIVSEDPSDPDNVPVAPLLASRTHRRRPAWKPPMELVV